MSNQHITYLIFRNILTRAHGTFQIAVGCRLDPQTQWSIWQPFAATFVMPDHP